VKEVRTVILGCFLALLCGAGRPAPAASVPEHVRGQWQPTDAQRKAVAELTLRFFFAMDHEKYDDSYALLTAAMHRDMPFGQWQATGKTFHMVSGAALGHRVQGVTWYKDPPNAPLRGIYAAVDYTADFENFEFACGYLVWYQERDGAFRLMRQEQNYIDRATAAKLTERQLAEAKARVHC